MDHLRRAIDSLFDAVWSGQPVGGTSAWVPPVTVVESNDALRWTVEVPGLKAEDLAVTVEDNVLTISGEKKVEGDEREERSAVRARRKQIAHEAGGRQAA